MAYFSYSKPCSSESGPVKKFAAWLALFSLCMTVQANYSAEKTNPTAATKLLTVEMRKIVDAHKQIYDMSCIPMSVEMVLKLLGRVSLSYYDQQKAWKYKTDGNFGNFDGLTLHGVTFHRQFSLPRDDYFPLEQLFETIGRELQAGRYVMVSLPAKRGWHIYVVCDRNDRGEFIAVSKRWGKTIVNNHVKDTVTKAKGTDILTYEIHD